MCLYDVCSLSSLNHISITYRGPIKKARWLNLNPSTLGITNLVNRWGTNLGSLIPLLTLCVDTNDQGEPAVS